MNATRIPTTAPDSVLLTLAQLLDRLDASRIPVGADQYRTVVTALSRALRDAVPGPVLRAVLAEHPAAAALYENLNYQHAGLCCTPLDTALAAELQATALIERLRGAAAR